MVEKVFRGFGRRWPQSLVDVVNQLSVPLPQQRVVGLHLLREPVRFHTVACRRHELLRERAGDDADSADYCDDYVLGHDLPSSGCGSQGYESAKFTWQNTGSFQPDSYGGGMEIVVDRANRLLHVHLSGFKSTVSLSSDFSVFHYASGPKPSRAVSLGCLWSIPGSNFAKQAKWNTDGSVSVIGGMAVNDRCLHTPRTLPIPAGVTFA